jgi:hypothetical protein
MKEKAQMIAAAALLALIALGAAAPAQKQTPATPQMNMMAQTGAADAELERLAEQMNHATGQARIDAMAQLLNALVQDRARMHEQMDMMMRMHEMMMQRGGHQGEAPGQMHHPPDAK